MKFRDAKKLRLGSLVHVDANDPIDICSTYPARILGITTMNMPCFGPKLIFLVLAEGSTERFSYIDHWDLPNYANHTGAFSSGVQIPQGPPN